MKKGFTLVELLAVIAVLGIISSIAVVSYSKVIKDNKVRECKRKVAYIEQKAIEYANETSLLDNRLDNSSLSNDEGYYIAIFIGMPQGRGVAEKVTGGFCEFLNLSWQYDDEHKNTCVSEDFVNPIDKNDFSFKINITKLFSDGSVTANAKNGGSDPCE